MSVRKHPDVLLALLVAFVVPHITLADSARELVREANALYAKGEFNDAIGKYDQALIEKPEVLEPKFNKANSYYRLDDLAQAMDLYKEVAAESKDMELVTKAKYNLGNTLFQRGSKQRDSDLQKALDDFKSSITHWRQVLDIDPENEKAARNIEVARLIIKDIIDQLNKQKQQQKDQSGQQKQDQQQQGQQQQPQDQQGSQQDPNQPQQQAQPQEPNQPQDQQQQDQQQQREEQERTAPDATAQEILDREQRQKEERQILQRPGYQKVERDW